MDIERLVGDPQQLRAIEALRERISRPEHAVSDVVDKAGRQYVDLVMEGGGMLGLALVGYTWALEQLGIRFMGLAGTSAGSINALLLAALGTPADAKSPKLLEELATKDFYDFVDGGADARALIETALDKRPASGFKLLRLGINFLAVKERLTKDYGLNRGDHFLYWLQGILDRDGVRTAADLAARLAERPDGLSHRERGTFAPGEAPSGRLVVIAADISTETRVELPHMASLYWADPDGVSPALFARASMAIPFFFEPLRVQGLPRDESAWQRWDQLAGLRRADDPGAEIPETALFVDGGIMSNFPIDAFHKPDKVPRMPTFGVKLQYDERVNPRLKPRGGDGFGPLLTFTGAIFNSARHTLDYEFVKRHPDYRHLVQFIPCTGVNWLDFSLPDDQKARLFTEGVRCALEFVSGFSAPTDTEGRPAESHAAFPSRWAFYKDLRGRLARSYA